MASADMQGAIQRTTELVLTLLETSSTLTLRARKSAHSLSHMPMICRPAEEQAMDERQQHDYHAVMHRPNLHAEAEHKLCASLSSSSEGRTSELGGTTFQPVDAQQVPIAVEMQNSVQQVGLGVKYGDWRCV